jgi:hypothetical protein
MQNYQRVYGYIHDYQRLIYDFYSKHSVSFLTTYYHINPESTIWEDENLFGGAYEKVGSLSGVRWDKILLLPVYFPDEITTAFDGQDIGYIKENEITLTIPSTYGFTPLPNDKIKLEQDYLRPSNNVYPIFSVTGVEKSTNADRLFWKLKCEIEQSVTETQLNLQVINSYVFFEYDKQIHTMENTEFMTRLLKKSETLKTAAQNLFDKNSGLYFI